MIGSDEISQLLAAERAAAPPVRAPEAGLQRLLTSLATQAAPVPAAVGSLKLGWSLIGKWIGVGFAVGAVAAGTTTVATRARDEASTVQASVPSASAAPTSQPATVATPLPEAIESAAPAPEPAPAARSAPSAPRPAESAGHGPTFDEELALIASAKRDLDAGRPHLAKVWLDEHARRFPSGIFSLEREGLSVLARCSERKSSELARTFAAVYPQSPLLEQVRARCGEVAPSSPVAPSPSAVDFPKGDK